MTVSRGFLTDKRAIRETLAALGVIVSLIFVGIEIRQNTSAVRGNSVQAIAQQNLEIALAAMTDGELLRTLVTLEAGSSIQDLDPAGRLRLGMYYMASLRITENRLRQVEVGILDEDALEQLGGVGSMYRTPYFQQWWDENKARFAADFVEFMGDQYGLK